MSCEKQFRGWPSAVVEYFCAHATLFPGLQLKEYARGIKTLVRFGLLPNPEDFRKMADIYRRNLYGKRTWNVIIEAVTASAQSGGDPFAQLEEMIQTGIKRWWLFRI